MAKSSFNGIPREKRYQNPEDQRMQNLKAMVSKVRIAQGRQKGILKGKPVDALQVLALSSQGYYNVGSKEFEKEMDDLDKAAELGIGCLKREQDEDGVDVYSVPYNGEAEAANAELTSRQFGKRAAGFDSSARKACRISDNPYERTTRVAFP
ncbi:MAG TPA: hypothetical protein VMZ91_05105 [Candidatus Paceibacterota bacterium]|nr:hypothetical protein [Candidatus Paceibacterota bacterium]